MLSRHICVKDRFLSVKRGVTLTKPMESGGISHHEVSAGKEKPQKKVNCGGKVTILKQWGDVKTYPVS